MIHRKIYHSVSFLQVHMMMLWSHWQLQVLSCRIEISKVFLSRHILVNFQSYNWVRLGYVNAPSSRSWIAVESRKWTQINFCIWRIPVTINCVPFVTYRRRRIYLIWGTSERGGGRALTTPQAELLSATRGNLFQRFRRIADFQEIESYGRCPRFMQSPCRV